MKFTATTTPYSLLATPTNCALCFVCLTFVHSSLTFADCATVQRILATALNIQLPPLPATCPSVLQTFNLCDMHLQFIYFFVYIYLLVLKINLYSVQGYVKVDVFDVQQCVFVFTKCLSVMSMRFHKSNEVSEYIVHTFK